MELISTLKITFGFLQKEAAPDSCRLKRAIPVMGSMGSHSTRLDEASSEQRESPRTEVWGEMRIHITTALLKGDLTQHLLRTVQVELTSSQGRGRKWNSFLVFLWMGDYYGGAA